MKNFDPTPLIDFIKKDYGLDYSKKLITSCYNLWCLNLLKSSFKNNETINQEIFEITEFLFYLSSCIDNLK